MAIWNLAKYSGSPRTFLSTCRVEPEVYRDRTTEISYELVISFATHLRIVVSNCSSIRTSGCCCVNKSKKFYRENRVRARAHNNGIKLDFHGFSTSNVFLRWLYLRTVQNISRLIVKHHSVWTVFRLQRFPERYLRKFTRNSGYSSYATRSRSSYKQSIAAAVW